MGAEWIFIYLKASRFIAPDDYPIIRNKIIKQVETMNENGEPNVYEIYPDIDKILNALEQ